METLSPRMRACLALVAEGETNGAIADRLCVTRETVRTHLDHAYRRLGLDDVGNPRVVAALIWAREREMHEEEGT